MQRYETLVLVHRTTADTTELLHVRADTEKQTLWSV